MVFNIHYISDTALHAKARSLDQGSVTPGTIVSYQEGDQSTSADDLKIGCDVLSFPVFVDIFDESFNPKVMVDVASRQLV